MQNWMNHIEINPKIMMGKSVVKGTRITVELILQKMSAGETIEDLLEAHPGLKKEHILAALGFASGVLKVN